MGYETIMYIGRLFSTDDNEPNSFQIIAMVDICKPGNNTEIIKLSKKTSEKNNLIPAYICSHDGYTHITSDNNRKKLCVINAKKVLNALKNDYKKNKYCRFSIAIITLKECLKYYKNLKIMFYGY